MSEQPPEAASSSPTSGDDDEVFPDTERPAGGLFDGIVDSIGSAFGIDEASNRVASWIDDALSDGPTVFDNHSSAIAGEFRFDPWWDLPPVESGGERKKLGRAQPVDISERIGVCVHQTACRFGTARHRRSVWRSRIEEGRLDDAELSKFGLATGIDACAERLALHERFWRAAYHWVALLNGDILDNNPATAYTFHGNGSNRQYLGIAAEGELPARESDRRSSDDEATELFVETNRSALRRAVDDARALGAPIEWVTAHRCWSERRRGDPGEMYWKEIVLPVADEVELRIDYDLRDRGGRPIPTDWDPSATHDWAGRA